MCVRVSLWQMVVPETPIEEGTNTETVLRSLPCVYVPVCLWTDFVSVIMIQPYKIQNLQVC